MIIILKATNKDIEAIDKITKQAFIIYQQKLNSGAKVAALSETKDDIALDIKTNSIFVAKFDDDILGIIRYKMLSGNLAYIYRFAVDSSNKAIGVGKQLLEFVFAKLTNNNIDAICLHTNTEYTTLSRYYQNHGFIINSVCEKKGYKRGLFVKELSKNKNYDLSPALKM